MDRTAMSRPAALLALGAIALGAWPTMGWGSDGARLVVAPEGLDVVTRVTPQAVVATICKDCTLTVYFHAFTSDPDKDGDPVLPVAEGYDPTIVEVKYVRQTAIYNGTPAEWEVTGLKAGFTRIIGRNPENGSTDTVDITVAEVETVVGEYLLTDPYDKGVSDSADDEVRAFWVARAGEYLNEVKLKARFAPAGTGKPGCFRWTVTPTTGAKIDKPGAANTTISFWKPGTYKVRAHCAVDYREITIHAIQVADVAWKAVYQPLSSNPGSGRATDPGSGQRLFAELINPGDPPQKARRVWVEATVTPLLPDVRLYFRSFDVDDPSWDVGLVDADTAGDDNRGSPKAGRLGLTSRPTNTAGKAPVLFEAPSQPGDNIRVGVATTRESADGLSFGYSIFIQDGRPRRINHHTPVAGVSPLLTIWRTMHLEVDRMQDVTGNFKVRRVVGVTDLSQTKTFVNLNQPISDPRGKSNQFENGVLVERGSGGRRYVIQINTDDSVLVRHPSGSPPRNTGQVEIYDDDVLTGRIPAPDLSLVNEKFRPAFVVHKADLPRGLAPFDANVGDAELEARCRFDSKGLRRSDYWAVYVLGAFQWDYNGDGDPDDEAVSGDPLEASTIRGLSISPGVGSAVFMETIRDPVNVSFEPGRSVAEQTAYTTCHELAHMLNAEHKNDFMASNDPNRFEKPFGAFNIRAMRSTVKP
ncbi:MAG: hypothetical protein FJX74_08310 [Armatimonadetes bacterium]|nr:hypothetical protein [Armatimonadota bacterium]